MQLALTLLAALVFLYLVFLVAATYVSLHPLRVPLWISPAMLGKPEVRVKVMSGDVALSGWWSSPGDVKLVVICCHGYLMNRCELLPMMVTLGDLNAAWMFFDFRTHGKSGGRTCTMGVDEAKDVVAIVAWVRAQSPEARVVLYGSSMGGAAAAIALGDDPSLADALILDGTYSNLDEAGRGWWGFVGGKWMRAFMLPTVLIGRLMLGFNPAKVAVSDYLRRSSHKPVLLLAGADDKVVSRAEFDRNVEASGTLTWTEVFEDSDHGEARFKHPDRYQQVIRTFIQEVVLGSKGGDSHNR